MDAFAPSRANLVLFLEQPQAHWAEPFAQLAVELALPESNVELALVRVRGFVARILRSSS